MMLKTKTGPKTPPIQGELFNYAPQASFEDFANSGLPEIEKKVVPLILKQANEFVLLNHRHHKPVQGHRFSLGYKVSGKIVGVIICGRPVARKTDFYSCLEVTRLCTDGTKNACSKLYSAAARVAKEMGFIKIQTFILESESGISLKASGWNFAGYSAGGQWKHTDENMRRKDQPICRKIKFEKKLNEETP